MKLLEQIKKRVSNTLSDLEDYVSGTDKQKRALDTLAVTTAELHAAEQLRTLGQEAYCLRKLGITKEELEQIRHQRNEPTGVKEKIKKLVPEASSFRKFITWTYAEYDEYKRRFRNDWKKHDEKVFIKNIRRLANSELSKRELFALVLNCFFLSTHR